MKLFVMSSQNKLRECLNVCLTQGISLSTFIKGGYKYRKYSFTSILNANYSKWQHVWISHHSILYTEPIDIFNNACLCYLGSEKVLQMGTLAMCTIAGLVEEYSSCEWHEMSFIVYSIHVVSIHTPIMTTCNCHNRKVLVNIICT